MKLRHTRRSVSFGWNNGEQNQVNLSEKAKVIIIIYNIYLLGHSWAVHGPVSDRKMNLIPVWFVSLLNYPSVSGTVKPIIHHRDSWVHLQNCYIAIRHYLKGMKTILNRIVCHDKETTMEFYVKSMMFTLSDNFHSFNNHVIWILICLPLMELFVHTFFFFACPYNNNDTKWQRLKER